MASSGSVGSTLRPVVERLLGDRAPVRVRFWDGSAVGVDGASTTLVVRSPLALRYLLWSPDELGLARAYVSGELDLDGDIYGALALRDHLALVDGQPELSLSLLDRGRMLGLLARLGALGAPPPPPPEEVHLRGTRHSRQRDAAAIAHHYDISNDFYALVLGRTMTYSCAYFARPDATLHEAQEAKYELICAKLGLRKGMRLLDVGCGWAGMVMHAAREHRVRAVGITISAEQAAKARERVEQAGLAGQVEIRLQDYRDVDDGPYDAISSIGMFEHVGLSRLEEYFVNLRSLLRAGGRLLNHAISRPGPERPGARHSRTSWHSRHTSFSRRSFVERYVFPDGELHEVGSVVSAMQRCGLEARDVECLREHYAKTLRAWVANLEANFDEAVRLVGAGRARVWRLYMAASALNFEANRTSIHQVLGVRTEHGWSGMPPTRAALLDAARSRTGALTGSR